MLTSTILKVDVVGDVIMTSTTNVLTTGVRDLLYSQCIGFTSYYSIFIYPKGRIRVCNIRFASIGESRGKPCLVCKKIISKVNKNDLHVSCACHLISNNYLSSFIIQVAEFGIQNLAHC